MASPSRTLLAATWFALAGGPAAIVQGQASPSPAGEQPRPAPAWVEMTTASAADLRLKGMRAPRGIKIEIVGEQAAGASAISAAFDDQGRLYVLEWTAPTSVAIELTQAQRADGSRYSTPRTTKSPPDVLKRLDDRDGDGTFDEVVSVMDDLALPSGLLVHDGWVYWTSGGRVVRRRPHDAEQLRTFVTAAEAKRGPPTQATADGRWIEQELIGGLSAVYPYQASGIALGHDGWLYVSAGSGDQRVQSWDGSQATVLQSGMILRARPDGAKIEEFARGLVAPHGALAFDALGNAFLVDRGAADSSLATAGLVHVLAGGDYGWRHQAGQIQGAFDRQSLDRPDRARASAGGNRPGTLPGLGKFGIKSAAGLLFYDGTAFPDVLRGQLLVADPAGHAVHAFGLVREGATFAVASQFTLLASDDARFAPGSVLQGPDGAIYIVERPPQDALFRRPNPGQGGRIYRLSWSGTPSAPAIACGSRDRWSALESLREETLWPLLEQNDGELRRRAARRLMKKADGDQSAAAVHERLVDMVTNADRPAIVRATALWALSPAASEQARDAAFDALLGDDPEIVRLAAVAIGDSPPAEREALTTAAERVERALGAATDAAAERALRRLLGRLARAGDEGAAEWGFESMSVTLAPQTSRQVFDGHVRALEMVPGAAKDLMLGNLDVAINFPDAEPQERQRIKQFVTRTAEAMRTRELTSFLDALLSGEEDLLAKIDAPLEARLLAAYRNVLVEPPIDADAVALWIEKHPGGPPEVEMAALETLAIVGTTKTEIAKHLTERLLSKPATAAVLARRLLDGHLPASYALQVATALRAHSEKAEPTNAVKTELAPLLRQVEALRH